MEREMEKDNLLFGILNPLCPFSFSITTHIPIVSETNPPFTITLPD
jgi:hypothetical protein